MPHYAPVARVNPANRAVHRTAPTTFQRRPLTSVPNEMRDRAARNIAASVAARRRAAWTNVPWHFY